MIEGAGLQNERIRRRLDKSLRVILQHDYSRHIREVGTVASIFRGIAKVTGLPDAMNNELLKFSSGGYGWVFNLDRDSIGCVLLDHPGELVVGQEVQRTCRLMDVPVGDSLLSRVIDPFGRPLDNKGPIEILERRPIESPAPAIMDRAPVTEPLQTGIKVLDALVPIGRGQRQLIIGDRQTGKTSIAIDTIINQQDSDVVCVYCAVGQRNAAVAKLVHQLNISEAMNHCVVVVGSASASAGLQFVAPYAAMTIAEYFMRRGRHTLIVFDELSAHAKAFREISLLMRRSPGREAYPGDVFYTHARLLERATCLKEELGGGSLTALPIFETEAGHTTAYIPTNLISITDGQIYLSRDLFQKAILPAVDVGRSVSRVGGKAQLPAYRSVTGALRLAYAQFEELEKFAKFSSQLDEDSRAKLTRGQRVREVLKQSTRNACSVVEQIITFVALTNGLFDDAPISEVQRLEIEFGESVLGLLPKLSTSFRSGKPLSPDDIRAIVETCQQVLKRLGVNNANA